MISTREPSLLTPPARNVGRLQMLDVARLIAAIGVIAAHVIDEYFPADPAWILGSYAVPFYLFVALYFTVRGFAVHPERAVWPYVVGRFKKLYVPFLVWNVLYDLLHVARHPAAGLTPASQIVWAAVYTHLYFLPFLLAVTLLLCAGIRPLMRSGLARTATIGVLVLIAIVVSCAPQPTWLADTQMITHETLWNFHRAVPAACLAVCFALLTGARSNSFKTNAWIALAGLSLTISCLAIEYRIGQHGLLRAGSGFGLVLVAFAPIRAAWLSIFATLGRLSFGVYLSHVLVIRLVMTIVEHEGWRHDASLAIVVGMCALVGGLAISYMLSRSKWGRWVIGCEEPERSRRSCVKTPAVATLAAA